MTDPDAWCEIHPSLCPRNPNPGCGYIEFGPMVVAGIPLLAAEWSQVLQEAMQHGAVTVKPGWPWEAGSVTDPDAWCEIHPSLCPRNPNPGCGYIEFDPMVVTGIPLLAAEWSQVLQEAMQHGAVTVKPGWPWEAGSVTDPDAWCEIHPSLCPRNPNPGCGYIEFDPMVVTGIPLLAAEWSQVLQEAMQHGAVATRPETIVKYFPIAGPPNCQFCPDQLPSISSMLTVGYECAHTAPAKGSVCISGPDGKVFCPYGPGDVASWDKPPIPFVPIPF